MRPSHQDEASAAITGAEHRKYEPSELSQISTRKRKQPDKFSEPVPTNMLQKMREEYMISKKHQET